MAEESIVVPSLPDDVKFITKMAKRKYEKWKKPPDELELHGEQKWLVPFQSDFPLHKLPPSLLASTRDQLKKAIQLVESAEAVEAATEKAEQDQALNALNALQFVKKLKKLKGKKPEDQEYACLQFFGFQLDAGEHQAD